MSRLFCRSREDVQSSWKAALTSIELRCQLIFCPASQSSQFPGLFFPPKKSFSFWREIFFAAHDCIFVESSSTMFIDNNNNKKKNFGSKSFARVNSDLFSLISFCPPPPSFAPICEVVMSATPNFLGLARVSIGKIRFFWPKQKLKLARLLNSTDASLF